MSGKISERQRRHGDDSMSLHWHTSVNAIFGKSTKSDHRVLEVRIMCNDEHQRLADRIEAAVTAIIKEVGGRVT